MRLGFVQMGNLENTTVIAYAKSAAHLIQVRGKRRARAIPQKTNKSKEKCVYRLGFEFRRFRLPKGPL